MTGKYPAESRSVSPNRTTGRLNIAMYPAHVIDHQIQQTRWQLRTATRVVSSYRAIQLQH